MISPTHDIDLESAAATCAFAHTIGGHLRPGDTILLGGEIGAGKTHFCRCLIQSLLDPPEDVPSPTFTLVQTYDSPKGEIWHADLYRLSDTSELVELGLSDAFSEAICLVEWPDRLGSLAPANALSIEFVTGETTEARTAHISWSADKWNDLIDRVKLDQT